MRFVLARHGESKFSVRGALNGDPSIPGGLTSAGVHQARELGEALADEPFELCVTTEFPRTIDTADQVLADRDVPRLIVPELNDPRYGPYEGAEIADYRAWAGSVSSSEPPGEGGESRFEIIRRYALAARALLDRPEASILVVAHSLPLAYLIEARSFQPPRPTMPLIAYAIPYGFVARQLKFAASTLEGWLDSPTW